MTQTKLRKHTSLGAVILTGLASTFACVPLRHDNRGPAAAWPWQSKEKQRKQILSTLAARLVAVARGEPASTKGAKVVVSLAVQMEGYRLPGRELSGLALNPTGTELFANSDQSFDVLRLPLHGGRLSPEVTPDKISFKSEGLPGRQESLWEAIAIDNENRVFLINETNSTLECFTLEDSAVSFNGSKRLARLGDDFQSNQPKAKKGHKAAGNSGGEGFVLLGNGHILVLKEKHPASIIEYGPSGSTPQGYNPSLAAARGSLKCDGAEALEPLHAWVFSAAEDVEPSFDLSEITADRDGNLYLLSDALRAIFVLGNVLNLGQAKTNNPRSLIETIQVFDLPATIKKPEGLAVESPRSFFVLEDSAKEGLDNLFRLDF